MATVRIPPVLRAQTGGQTEVEVGGADVDLGLTAGLGAQHWWDANGCHGAETYRLPGAEELVVGELAQLGLRDLGRVGPADRAVWVAPHLELGEAGAERLEEQQAADQRLTDPKHELEHLVGLQQAHRPGPVSYTHLRAHETDS